MKRVLINRLINDFEEQINNTQDYIPLDIVDASPPFTIDTATFNEFKEYIEGSKTAQIKNENIDYCSW